MQLCALAQSSFAPPKCKATDAKKGDGSRALAKCPAIERIRRGEAYYGESFVLDTAYIAGDEPIRDASGHVIGIYSTGYVRP